MWMDAGHQAETFITHSLLAAIANAWRQPGDAIKLPVPECLKHAEEEAGAEELIQAEIAKARSEWTAKYPGE